MKTRYILGLLGLAVPLSMGAQGGTQSGTISPYSQYGIGILADQSQGVNRGMNGTGIGMREGTLVNTLNPASYSAVDSLTMLFDAGLSGQITNFKENGVSVNARNADFDYAIGLFRVMPHLGVSFGLLPYSDVGYSYTTSSYLNSTIGSITETYTGTGGFHQAFVGAGWQPVKHLSIGFNAGYMWGNYSRSVSSSATTTVNSLSKTYKAEVNSYTLSVGLQWVQPITKTDDITLGATMGVGHKLGSDPTCEIVNLNTSTLVSDTTMFSIKDGLKLPMTYGVGLSWRHADRLTVCADYTLQKWGGVDFPDYDDTRNTYALRSGLLADRTHVGIGVDYVPNPVHLRNYLKRIHYRFGAGYTSPYFKVNGQDGPKEFSVSAGLGLPLLAKYDNHRSVLNISAQWSHTSATDLITDNTFRISVGLTFNERWFAKWRIL